MKIKDSIALVTGANRGIGAALVEALLEGGAQKVYAAARHEGDLPTVGAQNDRRLVTVRLDVTNAADVARAARQAADVNILFMPGLGVYNASKAAAWSLTQSFRADFARRNVKVFSVFPGAVDTDMLKGVEMPKALPPAVASAVLKGVEAGEEDIFPDPMSRQLYAQWVADHKAIERQFAMM